MYIGLVYVFVQIFPSLVTTTRRKAPSWGALLPGATDAATTLENCPRKSSRVFYGNVQRGLPTVNYPSGQAMSNGQREKYGHGACELCLRKLYYKVRLHSMNAIFTINLSDCFCSGSPSDVDGQYGVRT